MQEDRNARSMCLREHWCVAISRHLFPCGSRLRLGVFDRCRSAHPVDFDVLILDTHTSGPSLVVVLSTDHSCGARTGSADLPPLGRGAASFPCLPHPRSVLRLKLKSTERGRTPFDMHAVWPRLHINFSRDNAFVYRGWCSSLLFSSVRTHARGNRCCFFRAQQSGCRCSSFTARVRADPLTSTKVPHSQ